MHELPKLLRFEGVQGMKEWPLAHADQIWSLVFYIRHGESSVCLRNGDTTLFLQQRLLLILYIRTLSNLPLQHEHVSRNARRKRPRPVEQHIYRRQSGEFRGREVVRR